MHCCLKNSEITFELNSTYVSSFVLCSAIPPCNANILLTKLTASSIYSVSFLLNPKPNLYSLISSLIVVQPSDIKYPYNLHKSSSNFINLFILLV